MPGKRMQAGSMSPGLRRWMWLHGVTTALGSVVLSRGTDYTNSIMKKSDFSIGGHSLILTGDAAYYRDDYALISEEIKEKLLLVRGIDSESVRVVRGAYLALDTEDQAWEPLMDAAEPDEGVDEAKPKQRVRQEGEATQQEIQEGEQGQEKIEQPQAPDIATVQIVDESYIRTLEEYVAINYDAKTKLHTCIIEKQELS